MLVVTTSTRKQNNMVKYVIILKVREEGKRKKNKSLTSLDVFLTLCVCVCVC